MKPACDTHIKCRDLIHFTFFLLIFCNLIAGFPAKWNLYQKETVLSYIFSQKSGRASPPAIFVQMIFCSFYNLIFIYTYGARKEISNK